MFGIEIISKNNSVDVNTLLKEELNRLKVDEYKLTALIELGANGLKISQDGESSGLEFAIINKFYTYLSSLLSITKEDDKALVWKAFERASKLNDEKAGKIILSAGIFKISRKENNRQTLLMIAVKYGNIKLAKELLKKRANMHAIDNAGKSVLDYAKESGSNKTIDLIKHVIKKDNERVSKLKDNLKTIA